MEKTTPKYPLRIKYNKYITLNSKGFQCLKCQGWVQKASECPNKRNVILREERLYYLVYEVGERIRIMKNHKIVKDP